jgi:hypothetical protein
MAGCLNKKARINDLFKKSDKNTKMKKIISLLLLLVLIVGCKDELFSPPKDANGNIIFHGVSSSTTTGVSTLDAQFSITATLPNAKSGDVMNIECLQLQIPAGSTSTSTQLLPLAGTQKTATVGSDLKATITYTRAEAKLVNLNDYVVVAFNGLTDYATQRVTLVAAVTSSKPAVTKSANSIIELDVARTAETAFFNVKVTPKSATYTGTLVVTRKNGATAPSVTVTGSPFANAATFLVPITGTDFAVGKDTMIYSFSATMGALTEVLKYTVIVRDPYFYLKKTGVTLALGTSSAGRNLLINTAVAENAATANLAVLGTLILKGGSAWVAAGHTISFVPSTLAMYDLNNTVTTIAAFNAGTPTATADPIGGTGVYIYKMVNGPTPADIYYGMIKVTNVLPGVSVTMEYRIGDQYAHLLVIK